MFMPLRQAHDGCLLSRWLLACSLGTEPVEIHTSLANDTQLSVIWVTQDLVALPQLQTWFQSKGACCLLLAVFQLSLSSAQPPEYTL